MALFTEWSERIKLITSIVVAVVVNIVIGVFLYLAVKKHNELQRELTSLQKEVEALREKANQLPAKKEVRRRVEAENADILKKLPPQSEIPLLMDRISEVASQAPVQLKDVRKVTGGPPPIGAAYVKELWGTSIEANFHSLVKFINHVEENFDRFIAFEDLTIASRQGGLVPHGTGHDVRVNVATYRYLQQ
ncbi:MAG: type 4a pilus biogenesis protein PilO [Planctomycetota bacterium]|nr:type 4a pilus biogenesis protein PilO [Planctomycetota bacterium]